MGEEKVVPVFDIPFDSIQKTYQTVEIPFRLFNTVADSPNEKYSEGIVNAKAAQKGLLTFKTRQKDTYYVIIAEVAPELLRRKDFFELIKQPVRTEVEFIPSPHKGKGERDGPGAIKGELLIRIAESTFIEWSVEEKKLVSRSGEIVLPADGKSSFTLLAAVRRLHPTTGKAVESTDEYLFKYSVVLPEKLKTIKPLEHQIMASLNSTEQSALSEKTLWKSREILNAALPVKDIYIEIRAYRKGTQQDFSKDSLYSRTLISVVLEEPPVKILMTGTSDPIPADSSHPVTFTFQAVREANAAPVTGKFLAWKIDSGKVGMGGFFDIEEGITDIEGRIHCTYTPPDLFYVPGISTEAVCNVYESRERKKTLLTEHLHFTPGMRIIMTAEKKGLDFGISEIERTPEKVEIPTSFKGTLLLESSDSEDEKSMLFPVKQAMLSVNIWNGREYEPLDEKIETGIHGEFSFSLSDKTSHGKMHMHTLHKDEVPCARINKSAEKALLLFESELKRCPPSLLTEKTIMNLKGYRELICRQFAEKDLKHSESITSSLDLLRQALSFTRSFEQVNRELSEKLHVSFDQTFSTVIELTHTFCAMGRAFKITHISDDERETVPVPEQSLFPLNYLTNIFTSRIQELIKDSLILLDAAQSSSSGFIKEMFATSVKIFKDIKSISDALTCTAEKLKPYGSDNYKEAVQTLLPQACELIEKTSHAAGYALLIIFIDMLHKSVLSCRELEDHFKPLLFHCHNDSFELLRHLFRPTQDLKSETSDSNVYFSRIFERLADNWADESAKAFLSYLSSMSAQDQNFDKESAMSSFNGLFEIFTTAADTVFSHIYEQAKALKAIPHITDQKGEEMQKILSLMKSLKGKAGNQTVSLDSHIDSLQRFIIVLEQFFCLAGTVAALSENEHAQILMKKGDMALRALRSVNRLYPGLAVQCAGVLYLAILFAVSTLNMLQEEPS